MSLYYHIHFEDLNDLCHATQKRFCFRSAWISFIDSGFRLGGFHSPFPHTQTHTRTHRETDTQRQMSRHAHIPPTVTILLIFPSINELYAFLLGHIYYHVISCVVELYVIISFVRRHLEIRAGMASNVPILLFVSVSIRSNMPFSSSIFLSLLS